MKNYVAATRPPLLDEKNYVHWKIQTKVYIKAIVERLWKSVVTGWTHPIVTTDEVTTIKSEKTWPKKENSLATHNFKVLNVIFAFVDSIQFKLISACECAKDAWTILQNVYKGTGQDLQASNACFQIWSFKDVGEMKQLVISTLSCVTLQMRDLHLEKSI